MISVIIPFDKDRGFLDECYNSIAGQVYSGGFEIILAQGNHSVAKNFNEGLKRAEGKFCKFVCEDDFLPDFALQHLSDGIGDYDWVYANSIQFENNGEWIYKPEHHDLKSNIEKNAIHGGTTLYRTGVLRAVGGMDESLWTGEEYDMHLKLWTLGYVPGYVNKEVYVHRLWSGQKSKIYRKQNLKKRQDEIKRIQSFYFDKV